MTEHGEVVEAVVTTVEDIRMANAAGGAGSWPESRRAAGADAEVTSTDPGHGGGGVQG